MGKSFSTVIDNIAENQHDMKELIQNWAQLISSTAADITFTMFDSSTYVVPNFAKITQQYGAPYEEPQYPTDSTVVKRTSGGGLKSTSLYVKSLAEYDLGTEYLYGTFNSSYLQFASSTGVTATLERNRLYLKNDSGNEGTFKPRSARFGYGGEIGYEVIKRSNAFASETNRKYYHTNIPASAKILGTTLSREEVATPTGYSAPPQRVILNNTNVEVGESLYKVSFYLPSGYSTWDMIVTCNYNTDTTTIDEIYHFITYLVSA